MRTVELVLMHVTANFRCQVHIPSTMVPGHEKLDSCEQDTLTPAIDVTLSAGPFEIVVANFDAIARHFIYSKNIIHL